MKKQGIALLCAGALAVTSLPQVGLAADDLSLGQVRAGSSDLTLQYKGARAGDWYHVYLGDQYLAGQLSADAAARGSLQLTLPRAAADGDLVNVRMAGSGNHFLSADTKVTAAPTPAPAPASGQLTAVYPSEVKPGSTVKPRIYLNDQGRMTDVSDDAVYSYSGPIVAGSFIKGGFTVAQDAPEGSIVTLRIMYGDQNIDKRLVIRSSASETPTPSTPEKPSPTSPGNFSLARTQVDKDKAETIDIALKQTDSRAKALGVAVVHKENAAKVTASVADPAGFLASGKGQLKFKADREGAVDLELRAFDAAGKVLDRYPFQIMVGKSGLAANQVRMTIGLKSLVIGNEQKAMDTAPFIQDNRTFVPLRALAEAFGAKVDYKAADQTIHIQMADKTVVMTIGEKTFTDNGKTKTMDVAPYLSSGGRTIVPVRFAAEGLGFKITTTADAEGLTTDLIFSKAK
ncbi:copper amine oxidase N-terminal domain-containing protein [Peptococcus simiae]|uniref:copper amine oxidase N-terminal domain-containing protein n=1 Tax=Peptococcus simiae TaxID=1643805 RepID=UPI003980F4C6